MKTAFECYQEAAKCERLADDAELPTERTALLDAAAQWRELGKAVTTAERKEITGPLVGPA